MRVLLRTTCTGAALALLCLVANAANPTYRLTRIGPDLAASRGDRYVVDDMNDKGEIVGFHGFTPTAFLWRNGITTDIGDPASGNIYLEATAINNRGEIVGDLLDVDGHIRGFFWRDGHISDLGQVGDRESMYARDINSQRQIVIERYENNSQNGPFPSVRWGGQERTLEPLPGGSARHATAINELGIVVGSAETADGWQDGALWLGTHPIDLGRTPIPDPATATAINKWMQVVGTSTAAGQDRSTAWLWQFGMMTVLPSLHNDPDWSTRADDINNRGQIVGTEFNRFFVNQRIAVLWHENTVFNLNDLVDSNDPLKPYVTLTGGVKVNNLGWIVATGFDSSPQPYGGPYLLTPVGE